MPQATTRGSCHHSIAYLAMSVLRKRSGLPRKVGKLDSSEMQKRASAVMRQKVGDLSESTVIMTERPGKCIRVLVNLLYLFEHKSRL